MEPCPKCGRRVEPQARVCGACGVIISKVRPRTAGGPVGSEAAPARPPRPLPPSLLLPPPSRPNARFGPADHQDVGSAPKSGGDAPAAPAKAALKVTLAGGLAVAAIVALTRLQSAPPPATLTSAPLNAPIATQGALSPPAASESPGDRAATLSPEDGAFLNALFARLDQGTAQAPTKEEIERIDALLAGNPENVQLKAFALGVYLRRADADLRGGDFPRVDESLGKAKALDNRQAQIYLVEAQARIGQGDWAGVLESSQRYDSLAGTDVIISLILADSLRRQGRRSDALSVLDRPVFQTCLTATAPSDLNNCRSAQQMRASLSAASPGTLAGADERPRIALDVDARKAQIQSEKFDVRFDGEDQAGVARDVLFVLDRAYVRLADVYYDRPRRKIPVVLHSSQDYFSKTGAPWWSGGQYNSHNGAIQIPIRGLPTTLPREMEDVLVHELSHAFVDEMSGGRAGKDLQEGLAQYMEGKRIEEELGAAELKRLANSGDRSVMSFYMLSLAVTQQLVQSRGQGMVNQLLKAMKETGSEDEGYKKVFGESGGALKRDILTTFWRRYS